MAVLKWYDMNCSTSLQIPQEKSLLLFNSDYDIQLNFKQEFFKFYLINDCMVWFGGH